MWLFYIAVPLLILAVIGSIFSGGIFTIVLVPLAVIALIAGFWSVVSARSGNAPGAQRRSHTETGPGGSALPHSFASEPGTASNSPEALADSRRELQ